MLTSRCTQNDITKDSHVAQLEKGRRAQRADPVLFFITIDTGLLCNRRPWLFEFEFAIRSLPAGATRTCIGV